MHTVTHSLFSRLGREGQTLSIRGSYNRALKVGEARRVRVYTKKKSMRTCLDWLKLGMCNDRYRSPLIIKSIVLCIYILNTTTDFWVWSPFFTLTRRHFANKTGTDIYYQIRRWRGTNLKMPEFSACKTITSGLFTPVSNTPSAIFSIGGRCIRSCSL